MQQVTREMPDTQLLLVGEGKEKKELVDLTEKLGMAKKVIFQDTVSSSSEVLSAIDVFVMPSLKEGLGLAIMEAMASGLPIVASNIGGIRSLIQDKVTGILVEPADTKGLASAIIGLLQNKEKALSLGQKAKAFIKENFSEANMVCQTEQLYLECLGKKNL
jgi:glycosyltransferase involved in cell wall biosynthesis